MAESIKRTFSLTAEQAAYIDRKVKRGEYKSASEVVRAGLRSLKEHDAAITAWLKREVIPTYEAVKAGRMRTYTSAEVRQHISALHARTVASRRRAG